MYKNMSFPKSSKMVYDRPVHSLILDLAGLKEFKVVST